MLIFFNIPRTHPIHDTLLYNNLVNNIRDPMRNSKSTSTLIDPILTKIETHVTSESGTLNVDSSVCDHCATFISLGFDYNIRRAYKRNIWDYKNKDFDKLNLLIDESNWSSCICEANNISQAAVNFTNHFILCVRQCDPEKNHYNSSK